MKKKSLIMLICALVIMSSVAFGTLAYMSDRESVSNRFTAGNVDIVVDETEVDDEGNPVPNPGYTPDDPGSDDPYKRTEEENEYPLIPGSEYIKDPTLTIRAGSEESYVRMLVTLSNAAELRAIAGELTIRYPEKYSGFDPADYVTGWSNDVWQFTRMDENTVLNTFTLEFRYPVPVTAGDRDLTLPALFETIRIPGELTNAHLTLLEGFTIDVEGNAIQTIGFTTADEAWAAFEAQMTPGSAAVQP